MPLSIRERQAAGTPVAISISKLAFLPIATTTRAPYAAMIPLSKEHHDDNRSAVRPTRSQTRQGRGGPRVSQTGIGAREPGIDDARVVRAANRAAHVRD